MKTLQDKEKFIALRAEGNSFDKISSLLNISKPVLIKWNIELSKEIKNAEFLKYENILEQYKIINQKKVEFLAKQIDKINLAIDSESFQNISIKDLIVIRKELSTELTINLQSKSFLTGSYETSDFDKVDNFFKGKEKVIRLE